MIVHTSGSTPLAVFGKKFPNCGVLYLVQTISLNYPADPANLPLCIEASNRTIEAKLVKLGKSISGDVNIIDSDSRKYIHLAAVFANNFTNHLFVIAESLLKKKGISFSMLHPLVMQTALKACKESPGNVQTGPAKRGDKSVMKSHLALLKSQKKLSTVYKLLSESISETSGIRL